MANGSWLVVDEDGHGDALRQAVSAHARLLAVSDPLSARRILGTEAIAGLLLCIGKRTLSLRSLCSHVRQHWPDLPIVAVRDPGQVDDAALVAVVDAVIDNGPVEALLVQLERVTSAFEISEPTMVLLPSPRPAAVADATDVATDVAIELDLEIDLEIDLELDLEPTNVSAAPDLADDVATETLVLLPRVVETEEQREAQQGSGPEILVRLACAGRTGRLLVADGEGAGTLEFSGGEPVAAEPATGDGGLYRRLITDGLLRKGQVPDTLPKGRLLAALVSVGLLTEVQVLTFRRSVLRDQLAALCRQASVQGVFVETTTTTTTLPSTAEASGPTPVGGAPRINIFGLIVDARRRAVAPEVLDALFVEIEGWQLTATPLLAQAASLVGPFSGGRDLAPLINGGTVGQQLLVNLDVDRSIGTLLLLALRDAGLITTEAPAAPPPSPPPPPSSPRPTAAGVSPRLLLGTGMAPDEDEIEAAYVGSVARADADLARAATAAEREALHDLRQRLDIARHALRLQLGFATSVNGSNPFG